ncbi:hypothetical protein ON010_g7321 [Phytophthora cinnamomi]|nr:hypothetical protein ON010_g7321 [Phytophthora cinnamomi]
MILNLPRRAQDGAGHEARRGGLDAHAAGAGLVPHAAGRRQGRRGHAALPGAGRPLRLHAAAAQRRGGRLHGAQEPRRGRAAAARGRPEGPEQRGHAHQPHRRQRAPEQAHPPVHPAAAAGGAGEPVARELRHAGPGLLRDGGHLCVDTERRQEATREKMHLYVVKPNSSLRARKPSLSRGAADHRASNSPSSLGCCRGGTLTRQLLVHEFSLGEQHPPLALLAVREHLIHQAEGDGFTQLLKERANSFCQQQQQQTTLSAQREARVAGDGERVHRRLLQDARGCGHELNTIIRAVLSDFCCCCCLPRTVGLAAAPVQLLEAQVHEERAVDEHAVGVALDLEVGEQHVGAEEREDLVHDVGLVLGRGRRRPAGARLDGQDGAAAGLLRLQLVERRVIRRHAARLSDRARRREERVCDAADDATTKLKSVAAKYPESLSQDTLQQLVKVEELRKTDIMSRTRSKKTADGMHRGVEPFPGMKTAPVLTSHVGRNLQRFAEKGFVC